jgi:hypothetical protein
VTEARVATSSLVWAETDRDRDRDRDRECRDRGRAGYKRFRRNALIALSAIGISFTIPLAQTTYIHAKTPIAYIDS